MLVLSVSTTDVKGELKNITDHYLNGQSFLNVNDPNSIQGMIDVRPHKLRHKLKLTKFL